MSKPRALLPDWLLAPAACYASWLLEHNFSRSTRQVYLSMFSKFAAYLAQEHIRLDRCTAANIEAFFIRYSVQKHQRYRYIRVIERAYDHLIRMSPDAGLTNPARRAAKDDLGAGANDPMSFLSPEEVGKVASFLAGRVAVEKNGKKSRKTNGKKVEIGRSPP